MRSWLSTYPKWSPFWGHLHWHLALSELEAGNIEEGMRLYDEVFGAADYQGLPRFKIIDAASFLWRAELAGHSRDMARWQALHDFAHRVFPMPTVHMVDWHVALADAV